MKFAILVNEGPYNHQAADSALNFAKAALEKGHEVLRVFFYHDGVNNATALGVPPQDDRNITEKWIELGKAHDLDLSVCVAAAQRRGMLDEGEAKRWSKPGSNIAEVFHITGLGQLVEASIEADRVLTFGD